MTSDCGTRGELKLACERLKSESKVFSQAVLWCTNSLIRGKVDQATLNSHSARTSVVMKVQQQFASAVLLEHTLWCMTHDELLLAAAAVRINLPSDDDGESAHFLILDHWTVA